MESMSGATSSLMEFSLSLLLVFVVTALQPDTTAALQSAAPLFNNFFWAIGVHVALVNRLQVVVDQASSLSCVDVICRFALSHQHHYPGVQAHPLANFSPFVSVCVKISSLSSITVAWILLSLRFDS